MMISVRNERAIRLPKYFNICFSAPLCFLLKIPSEEDVAPAHLFQTVFFRRTKSFVANGPANIPAVLFCVSFPASLKLIHGNVMVLKMLAFISEI